ncbi:MAG: SCO family protein [Chitinophagaceae bacterium]|nr:SCO family protein [Chitinophagaceae bacterium]
MNVKGILAILLAIVLPLGGYFIVDYYSKDAVHMPHRYFTPDSVVVSEKDGKMITDTIWHKVKNIQFTNQLGKKVSLDDLKGRILVINFFFTRCPTICPGLTKSMKRLQDSFLKNDSIVQFISISVDPEHDSVPQLRKFADRYNANHDTWWFVTGDKKEIYDFALNELKAGLADTEVDSAFIHTENFFLLDSNRVVRGWFNGFDSVKQAQLVQDIPLLMLEKDKKKPSVLRELIPILPMVFVAIGIVFVIILVFNRQKNKQENK